jgi:Spy/CpxP family protein refolding chaperone
MTTKELLYVDDALSHAQLLASQFDNAAARLQDNALRTQVQQMAQRHRQVYRQFYELV